ncbi:hypothetical protein [Paraburkholderia sp. BL10I2N1]|nr:hypothetical protein [Paraburkholderia sp. BL10I2N1]
MKVTPLLSCNATDLRIRPSVFEAFPFNINAHTIQLALTETATPQKIL